jgi:hypothetical protein
MSYSVSSKVFCRAFEQTFLDNHLNTDAKVLPSHWPNQSFREQTVDASPISYELSALP